jgi:hypothetical protein
MKKILLMNAASILLLSAGCSQMSKNKCEGLNASNRGYEDGVKGLGENTILELHEKCSKKGVEISLEQYKKGWKKGIAEYCSKENAFFLGSKGKEAKSSNCPVESRLVFDKHFKKGVKFKETKNKIKDLDEEINEVTNKIDDLESEVQNLKNKKMGLVEKKLQIRESSTASKKKNNI